MSIENAIIQLFTDRPEKIFGVQEIYGGLQTYYQLSDFQRELDPKHPQPRFHHEVRSILARLEKQGIIENLGRNKRRLKLV
ncbi:MAG: hypothetical protein HZA08_11680 [Nitrospirae bacterium]|nr:hypothetical protein [Nitrospirota bacterium]